MEIPEEETDTTKEDNENTTPNMEKRDDITIYILGVNLNYNF